jgi:two-component system, NarL family, response regulator DesR
LWADHNSHHSCDSLGEKRDTRARLLSGGQLRRLDLALRLVGDPDLAVSGCTGLDAADALAQKLPDCRILILTTFGRPGYLRRAMEGGAAGFLLKDAPATELAAAIRRVVAGERIVDPGLAAAALSEGDSPLTPREHEVLAAARRHATVADLARALFLSPGTVRNHLSSAMQKLDARNRAEAVRIAEERAGSRRDPSGASPPGAGASSAAERTRTSTPVRARRPERRVYTNFTTAAGRPQSITAKPSGREPQTTRTSAR